MRGLGFHSERAPHPLYTAAATQTHCTSAAREAHRFFLLAEVTVRVLHSGVLPAVTDSSGSRPWVRKRVRSADCLDSDRPGPVQA